MWGCDYGSMSGSWWGGFCPGILLFLLIWGLILFLIVYLAIRTVKSRTHGRSRDQTDSEDILKVRFARGEISREEREFSPNPK